MSKKKNKKYIQATKFYQDGEIDRALKKCEESIAEDLKNSASLNLKGLLLYLKGDLKGAVATWKINADFNDDDIARHYIQDSRRDSNKIKIYREAEVLLAKLSVNEAINKLKMCKESDFNAIKVNLALASCYLRKGDYDNAGVNLTKALSIDKNSVQGKKIAKEFQKYSDAKLQILNSSSIDGIKILKVVVSLAAIVAILFGGYKLVDKYMVSNNANVLSNNDESDINEDTSSKDETQEEASPKENSEPAKNDELKNGDNNIKVDTDKIQSCIDSKNYDEIYNLIDNLNADELKGKEQAITKMAQDLLQNEGSEYFYNNSMKYFKANDYSNALTQIQKAYKYSQKTHLKSEIVFFSAAINDKLKNNTEAIKFYEEYHKNYKKGDYIQEVLYKLIMIYKSEDLSKAKKYAEELNDNHPDSMYNNENVKSLLN